MLAAGQHLTRHPRLPPPPFPVAERGRDGRLSTAQSTRTAHKGATSRTSPTCPDQSSVKGEADEETSRARRSGPDDHHPCRHPNRLDGRARRDRRAAGNELPEGHPQRPPGRADGPRGAARRPRAARDPRPGEVLAARPGHRPEHRSPRSSTSTSTTKRACRTSRSTPTSQAEPLGLPVLLAADEHAGRRPGDPDGQRGRRAGLGTAADFAKFKGVDPALPVQVARRQARPVHRAADHRGASRPRASAATSAATSTSTPRATCTCRPATTRTRSSPTATRRSTSAPAATRRSTRSAPPANTNDLRGKILRIKVEADGGYTIPAGNLFPPGTAHDPSRDLPDGPAQPVPDRGRTADRRRSTSPTTRPTPARPTRCAGPPGTASGSRVTQAGNYGWPYCATAQLPYLRLRLRHRHVGRRRSTARRRSTSRRTTPACASCRR